MATFSWFVGIASGIVTVLAYFHVVPVPEFSSFVAAFSPASPRREAHQDVAAPLSFDDLYSEGLLAMRRKKFPAAAAKYRSAVDASAPDSSDRVKVYDALGYAYLRMTDYAQAEAAFRAALGIDPDFVNSRINLVKLKCLNGAPASEVQAALQDLRSAAGSSGRGRYDVETDKELFRYCTYAGVAPQR